MNTKKTYCLLLVFLCFAISANGDEIERYVDTGSPAGGDGTTSDITDDGDQPYQSLNQWEAAEQTDLDTANNTHTVHCNRTGAGGTDTAALIINSWVTSATDYITIIGDDFPADGIWDGAQYVLDNDDSQHACVIKDNHVVLRKMQILVTITPNNSWYGVQYTVIAAGSAFYIDSCFIKGDCAGTGAGNGIIYADADVTLTCYNTIIAGFASGADTGFKGVNISTGTGNFYNCTIYGNYYGLLQTNPATITVINCAVFNSTDDYNGTITMTYSASDDDHTGDSATNVLISQGADDWAALVTDAAGDDFSVTDNSSELYQTGNGATPKAIFTDDIIDTERDAVDLNWDIGAYELVGGAAPTGQVIMISGIPIILIGAAVIAFRKEAA